MPVPELVGQMGDVLTALTPCLMPPEQRRFDLLFGEGDARMPRRCRLGESREFRATSNDMLPS
jgi:hypothetical protein